jgi:hypothetical protein
MGGGGLGGQLGGGGLDPLQQLLSLAGVRPQGAQQVGFGGQVPVQNWLSTLLRNLGVG